MPQVGVPDERVHVVGRLVVGLGRGVPLEDEVLAIPLEGIAETEFFIGGVLLLNREVGAARGLGLGAGAE